VNAITIYDKDRRLIIMGVLDKFLNAMKLNDDGYDDDDDFLDDEIDFEEERPKKRSYKRVNDYDDYDDYDYEEPPIRQSQKSSKVKQANRQSKTQQSSKVSPIRPRKTNGGMEVCVIKPSSMEDAREITETLIANCTVILNMEGLDMDVAQRIIDFSSGSCYAISGNLQKVSNYIFIISPSGVDVSGDFQEIISGAFDMPSIHTNF